MIGLIRCVELPHCKCSYSQLPSVQIRQDGGRPGRQVLTDWFWKSEDLKSSLFQNQSFGTPAKLAGAVSTENFPVHTIIPTKVRTMFYLVRSIPAGSACVHSPSSARNEAIRTVSEQLHIKEYDWNIGIKLARSGQTGHPILTPHLSRNRNK